MEVAPHRPGPLATVSARSRCWRRRTGGLRRPQPSSAAFVGPGQGKIGQDRPDPGSEPVVTGVGAILTLAPVCAAATLAPEVGGLATGLTARFTHHVQVEASSQA
jgi:hypothetical protein